MAEKLSVQIALEGGAEIEKQLADIGAAGQKAFADISKSAEQVGGFKNIKPDEVTQKLQDMGVTGVDSIEKIQKAVQAAGKLETLVSGITLVENALLVVARAAPIAGAAIVSAMTAATKATIAFAESVNKINTTAIGLGTGVEQVDKFRAALEKAGVSAQSIGEILKSKLASEQGIQGLEAFIRSLEQIPDSATRSKAAVEQFGAAGAELIRILQAGGRLTGFAAGGLISAEDAKKATELSQALSRLESQFNRLSTISLAPAITAGINTISHGVEILGIHLEQTPWTTFFNAANLGLSPIASLMSTINGAINALSPPIQKVGIEAQQAGLIFTQWGTVTTTAFAGVGTAAQQTGPQVTGMFTQWGTSADQATTKTQSFFASFAGIAWDSIASAGKAAWDAIVTAVQGAGTAITTFVSNLGTITWDIISGLGVAAWNALTGAIQGAIEKLRVFIGLKPSAPATGGGAPGKASGGLLGGRGTGTSDSNLAWVSRGEYIMPAAAVRQPGVLAFLEALRRSGRIPGFAEGGSVPIAGVAFPGGAGDKTLLAIEQNTQVLTKLVQTVDGLVKKFDETFTKLDEKLNEKFDELGQKIDGLVQTVNGLSQQVAALAQAIGQKSGKALGGLLGGRGTGTSDSNLAWVSRGEHIMPARAVSQPGVLSFLEALRRSGGNLRSVLDGMGRFALGGMIRGPMPAFAAGGLAGGMSNVTIQFPGLPAIGGLRASSDVVDQLHRAAALAQVRSGGRKPSRYS